MEFFRELILTRRGVWYRYYEEGNPKRISPRSYYAGEHVGWVAGLGVGFTFGIMTVCAFIGWVL